MKYWAPYVLIAVFAVAGVFLLAECWGQVERECIAKGGARTVSTGRGGWLCVTKDGRILY